MGSTISLALLIQSSIAKIKFRGIIIYPVVPSHVVEPLKVVDIAAFNAVIGPHCVRQKFGIAPLIQYLARGITLDASFNVAYFCPEKKSDSLGT